MPIGAGETRRAGGDRIWTSLCTREKFVESTGYFFFLFFFFFFFFFFLSFFLSSAKGIQGLGYSLNLTYQAS